VGREAEVVAFSWHEGQVTVDGVPWPARLDGGDVKLDPGDRVRIIAADGIVVWVRKI
ncbi:MAG: NfeD family protein, partial [Rhodobacteraceae bacterium]|nr:NfeD family protein [Paracoccaceae bacterium]